MPEIVEFSLKKDIDGINDILERFFNVFPIWVEGNLEMEPLREGETWWVFYSDGMEVADFKLLNFDNYFGFLARCNLNEFANSIKTLSLELKEWFIQRDLLVTENNSMKRESGNFIYPKRTRYKIVADFLQLKKLGRAPAQKAWALQHGIGEKTFQRYMGEYLDNQ
jgi:hypothetical protein